MSVPVPLGDLVRALADFDAGFLLTTTDGRVKVVTVEPEPGDGVLTVRAPGRGTCRNVAANPQVTLAFPPREARGLSLLVDGTAALCGGGEDVAVTPTHAVLHRPAAHADHPPDGDGCGHDCHPVG